LVKGRIIQSTGKWYLISTDQAEPIRASLPGKFRLNATEQTNPVAVGDRVTRGTPLLVLEAMKIEHTLTAPFDGVVEEIRFQPGDQVLAEGIELVTLGAEENSA